MKRPAAFRRGLLLVLVPLLAGCEESEIPIEPEGEPRFTNLVIDLLGADPEPDDEVGAGLVAYDVEASYQLSQGWEDIELDAYLVIESYANGVFVRTELTDVRPISADAGSFGFDGEFTLADCGDVDEVAFFIALATAPDLVTQADSDFYFVDAQTANVPC
jgi:hypothetical protein